MTINDIKETKDIFLLLNEICDNEKNYSDSKLAQKLNEVSTFCCGGNGKDFYFITHMRSQNIVEKRVEQYCKSNKIKIENYNGVLPYRKIIIEGVYGLNSIEYKKKKRKEKLIKIKNTSQQSIFIKIFYYICNIINYKNKNL